MQETWDDIRWKQRFISFKRAFNLLERFISKTDLNEMKQQGLIKAFEYSYGLSWKTLQDLLKEKGFNDIIGPKPIIEQSFQNGYISDGSGWIKMYKSRNLTSHTYDEDTAIEVVSETKNRYFYLLKDLCNRLEKELSGKQNFLFNE